MVLVVARSRIPGGGGGLFTTRPIRKGACFAPYTGTPNGPQIGRPRGYILYASNQYIDAFDERGRLLTRSGRLLDTNKFSQADWDAFHDVGIAWKGVASLARFANHSTTASNAKYCNKSRCSGVVSLVAQRDIRAGEEILCQYGSAYWRDVWQDECSVCGKGGNMLCCDACDRAFHPRCVGESDDPRKVRSTWVCPHCRGGTGAHADACARGPGWGLAVLTRAYLPGLRLSGGSSPQRRGGGGVPACARA